MSSLFRGGVLVVVCLGCFAAFFDLVEDIQSFAFSPVVVSYKPPAPFEFCQEKMSRG